MTNKFSVTYPIDFHQSGTVSDTIKNRLISVIATKSGISRDIISIIDQQLTNPNLESSQKKLIVKSYKNEISHLFESIVILQKKLNTALSLDLSIFNQLINKIYIIQLKRKNKFDKSIFVDWIDERIGDQSLFHMLDTPFVDEFNEYFGTKYRLLALYQLYHSENRKRQSFDAIGGGKVKSKVMKLASTGVSDSIGSENKSTKIISQQKINTAQLTYDTIPEKYRDRILGQLQKDHNQADVFLIDRFKEYFKGDYNFGLIRKMLLLVREHHHLPKNIGLTKLKLHAETNTQKKLAKKKKYQMIYDCFKDLLLKNPDANNWDLFNLYQTSFSNLGFTYERARQLYFIPLRQELYSEGLGILAKKGVKEGPRKGYEDISEVHTERLGQFINDGNVTLEKIIKSFFEQFDVHISSYRVKKELFRLRKESGLDMYIKTPKGSRAKIFTPSLIAQTEELILSGIKTNLEILDLLGIETGSKKSSLGQISLIRRRLGMQALKGKQAQRELAGDSVVEMDQLTIEKKNQIITYLNQSPDATYREIINHCGLLGCSKGTIGQYLAKLKRNGLEHLPLETRKLLELECVDLLKNGYTTDEIKTILGEKYILSKALNTYLGHIAHINGLDYKYKKSFIAKEINSIRFPIFDSLSINTIPLLIKNWLLRQYELRSSISDKFLQERFFDVFGDICYPTYASKMISIVRENLGIEFHITKKKKKIKKYPKISGVIKKGNTPKNIKGEPISSVRNNPINDKIVALLNDGLTSNKEILFNLGIEYTITNITKVTHLKKKHGFATRPKTFQVITDEDRQEIAQLIKNGINTVSHIIKQLKLPNLPKTRTIIYDMMDELGIDRKYHQAGLFNQGLKEKIKELVISTPLGNKDILLKLGLPYTKYNTNNISLCRAEIRDSTLKEIT